MKTLTIRISDEDMSDLWQIACVRDVNFDDVILQAVSNEIEKGLEEIEEMASRDTVEIYLPELELDEPGEED